MKERERKESERERERQAGYCVSLQDPETKAPPPLLAPSTRGRDLEAEGVLFRGGEGAVTGVMIFLLFFMTCAAISFCS